MTWALIGQCAVVSQHTTRRSLRFACFSFCLHYLSHECIWQQEHFSPRAHPAPSTHRLITHRYSTPAQFQPPHQTHPTDTTKATLPSLFSSPSTNLLFIFHQHPRPHSPISTRSHLILPHPSSHFVCLTTHHLSPPPTWLPPQHINPILPPFYLLFSFTRRRLVLTPAQP